MTLARALVGRWLRLAAALGAGLTLLLAATQLRRWLAADRAWTAADVQRLVGDASGALAAVAAVAGLLAAVETALRLRRDGVLTTLCVSAAAVRRLAGAVACMALATGGAMAAAAAAAAATTATAPTALRGGAAGWQWQPWPAVEAVAFRLEELGTSVAPALAPPSPGVPWSAIAAGGAGAVAVAAAFAWTLVAAPCRRMLPHVLALDALAVVAALWCTAPAAAFAALAAGCAWSWWRVAAVGARRVA